MYRCRLLALLLPLLLLPLGAPAQSPYSWGRAFWLTFPPIAGANPTEPSQLRLVVHSMVPTEVTVTSVNGQWSETFPVDPVRGTSIDLDELSGPDADLQLRERRSRKSFLVESSAPVTVSALATRALSADAMLVLPLESLGDDYVVLAAPNGASKTANGELDYDMPSQFAIVAPYDGTTVTITRSHAGGASETIELARGEVYLEEAPLNAPADVSGSTIVASRPVAVFAGVRRASVPTEIGNFRDYLVEQLMPVSAWQDDAVALPPFRPADVPFDAVVRLITAQDATIQVNGVDRAVTARTVLELPLGGALHLRGSVPFEAVVLEHSSTYGDDGDPLLGDPSMMLVVPTRRFDTACRFESFESEEFLAHYITVVAPDAAAAELRLDGAAVAWSFERIAGTEYSFAHHRVTPGTHRLSGPIPFGAYVYGFGNATSYAYPASIGGSPLSGAHTEGATEPAVLIAPNPASDHFTVKLAMRIEEGMSLVLIDSRGSVMRRIRLRPGSDTDVRINRGDLPAGVYLCALRVGSDVIAAHPVILR